MKDYYVYQLKYQNQIVYIGYGRGQRLKHLTSGRSHNPYINIINIFASSKMKIVKIGDNLDKPYAQHLEKECIQKIKPIFNRGCNPSFSKEVAENFLKKIISGCVVDQITGQKATIDVLENRLNLANVELEVTKHELDLHKIKLETVQNQVKYLEGRVEFKDMQLDHIENQAIRLGCPVYDRENNVVWYKSEKEFLVDKHIDKINKVVVKLRDRFFK